MPADPRQFDVFRLPNGAHVVVVQNDLLDEAATRVVAPLYPVGSAGRGLRSLNPEIAWGSEPHVLMAQLLATLTKAELGERVGDVVHERDAVVRAIDALLSGI